MAAAVTDENFGAWLIRCNPKAKWDLPGYIADGGTHIGSWSVVHGYRSERMAAGDKVLLWVSGDSRLLDRGIWGVGYVTGPAHDYVPNDYEPGDIGYWINEADRDAIDNIVDVDIPLFDAAITDVMLRAAGIDDLEVHRQPQIGNPSWVSKEEFARLEELLPPWPDDFGADTEITVADSGAGFGTAAQNALVELAAMEAVIGYYEDWSCDDVSDQNLGWDITFEHEAGDVAKVEVKGVSGGQPIVLLTANELRAAEKEPEWVLAVVTRALSAPQVTEFPAQNVVELAKAYVFKADLRELSV